MYIFENHTWKCTKIIVCIKMHWKSFKNRIVDVWNCKSNVYDKLTALNISHLRQRHTIWASQCTNCFAGVKRDDQSLGWPKKHQELSELKTTQIKMTKPYNIIYYYNNMLVDASTWKQLKLLYSNVRGNNLSVGGPVGYIGLFDAHH